MKIRRGRFATDAEAQAGTGTKHAVTPANVAAVTATETRAGVAELATSAEALAGTDTGRIMPPVRVAGVLDAMKYISFDGKNGAGACTATGAVVGDVVVGVFGITGGALGDASASFESAITVVDEIQQSAVGDLSANDYVAVLRAVA